MEQRFWQVEPSSLAAAQSDAAADGGSAGTAGSDATSAAGDALEKRVAERLLGDETLRADLTDDEYQPLQDWALDSLHRRVAALADPATPEAETEIAHVAECLSAVLRAANDSIGRRADLDAPAYAEALAAIRTEVESAIYGAEGPATDAQRALEALLPELAARKDDLDGAAATTALAAALRGEYTAVGGENTT